MAMKFRLDGIELTVTETISKAKFNKTLESLSNRGCKVEDLSTTATVDEFVSMVSYNFDKMFYRALQFSKQSPPNVVYFSESLWGSVTQLLRAHVLQYYDVLPISHRNNKTLVRCVQQGLTKQDARKLGEIWRTGESCHRNFYKTEMIEKRDRIEILTLVNEMPGVIFTAIPARCSTIFGSDVGKRVDDAQDTRSRALRHSHHKSQEQKDIARVHQTRAHKRRRFEIRRNLEGRRILSSKFLQHRND